MGTYIEKSTGHKRYNMPTCRVCDKQLSDKRYSVCGSHADKSYRTGKPSKSLGKKWKINMTPERKARWSELGKSRKHSEETKQKMRVWHIQHPNLIRQDTSIELMIQDELADRQILFIKQFSIEGVAKVDFFLPDINVIIQCDGCYWHNCLEHYPAHHQGQRVKDRTKDSKLIARGFKVFRLWEHDIKKSPKDCVDSLNLDIIKPL